MMLWSLVLLAGCMQDSAVRDLYEQDRIEYVAKCQNIELADYLSQVALPELNRMQHLASSTQHLDQNASTLAALAGRTARLFTCASQAQNKWLAAFNESAKIGLAALRDAGMKQSGHGLTVLRRIVEQSIPDEAPCRNAEYKLRSAHAAYTAHLKAYESNLWLFESMMNEKSSAKLKPARERIAAISTKSEHIQVGSTAAAWQTARTARTAELRATIDQIMEKAHMLELRRSMLRGAREPAPRHVYAATAFAIVAESQRRVTQRREEANQYHIPCFATRQALRDVGWARARLSRWKDEQRDNVDDIFLAQIETQIRQLDAIRTQASAACHVRSDESSDYATFLRSGKAKSTASCVDHTNELLGDEIDPQDFHAWYSECGPA